MFTWVPSFIRRPVERDYPWRYTSLITFILFLLLTVSLTIFNIPIAAYSIVTVNTNTPNETDTIKHDRFDRFFRTPQSSRRNSRRDSIVSLTDVVLTDLEDSCLRVNVTEAASSESPEPKQMTGASLLIQPCCECDGLSKTDYILVNGSIVDHLPCGDAIPARLSRKHLGYELQDPISNSFVYLENNTLAGNGRPTSDGGPLNFFSDDVVIIPDSMARKIHNVVQVMYHALRLDLGVISSNSIFTNPITYNQTLLVESIEQDQTLRSNPVYTWRDEGGDENRQRTLQSLSDMVGLLQSSVINTNVTEQIVRVPRLTYIAHRLKVKSKLSACVKVFVAVFAMLSSSWAIWKIFLIFLAESDETKKSGREGYDTVTIDTGSQPFFQHDVKGKDDDF